MARIASKEKNIAKIVKKNLQPPTKNPTKAGENVVMTTEERVKEKVDTLLNDIDILKTGQTINNKSENESPIEPLSVDNNKSIDWLEEQIELLSNSNNELKSQLADAKMVIDKTYEDLLKIFAELQTHALKYNENIRNQTIVNVVYLLNKLVNSFPFLSKYKKF